MKSEGETKYIQKLYYIPDGKEVQHTQYNRIKKEMEYFFI